MKQSIRPYLYTDMASELYKSAQQNHTSPIFSSGNPLHDSGIDYSECFFGNTRTEKLVVASEEASSVLGKSVGTYYTVHTGNLRTLTPEQYAACTDGIRYAVFDGAAQLCPNLRMHRPSYRTESPLTDAGGYAWEHTAVSPEWDQQGHLYNAPPAAVLGDRHADRVRAEGEPFLSSAHDDRTAVTDIPPSPNPSEQPLRPVTVLAVGLGNPALTPDALGPRCTEHLAVTGHLFRADNGESSDSNVRRILEHAHRLCAVTPLVVGQTGIETLDLVRGAIDASHPDLVILIDALAACETETLTSTVQVSTTGVTPGGGVGNRRQALDRDALGVPVMTVGVPTVISAKALIYRALTGAGVITEDGGNPTEDALLHRALASADAGYVTPNNIDASVSAYARLLAQVINELVLGRKLAAQLCAFA